MVTLQKEPHQSKELLVSHLPPTRHVLEEVDGQEMEGDNLISGRGLLGRA